MMKKSKLKESVEALKALFSATVKLVFSQFEDEDGNVYQYSVLEKGAEVFKAGADGVEPAPNGEYKIDEITSIVVVDGLIDEVKSEEVEEVKVEAEIVEDEDMKEFTDETLKAFEELKAMYDELLVKYNELDSKINKVEDKVEDEVKAINEGFSKLANTPGSKSKLTKTDVEKTFNINGDKNMSELQSIFSKIKK